ncbi:MAG: hypothetical protein ACT4OY_00025 [Alphaproteobacteria bacterium]
MTDQRFIKKPAPTFNKEAADGYYRGPKLTKDASLDEVYKYFEEKAATGDVRLNWRTSPDCSRSAELTVTFKTGVNDPAELSQVFFYTSDPEEKEWQHVIGLSTQVGCTYACQFCGSAGNPLKANLTEEQFAFITRTLMQHAEEKGLRINEQVRINMTGEGDPGANAKHVIAFLPLVQEIDERIKRVMVSTAGNLTAIKSFQKALDKLPKGFLELQSSVHFRNMVERGKVVLLPADVDVEEFIVVSREFAEKAGTKGRLNWVVMPGWNTLPADAEWLANLPPEYFYVTLVQLNPAEATEKMRKDAPAGALVCTREDIEAFATDIAGYLPEDSALVFGYKGDRAAELFMVGCGQATSYAAEAIVSGAQAAANGGGISVAGEYAFLIDA